MGMSSRSSRTLRQVRLAAALSASCVASAFAFASTASAVDAVCQSGPPGYQAGGAYCNLGWSYPIDYIAETANDGSIAVYRATASYLGAPSASGTEFYSSSITFTQSFHCGVGYPAEHNRHSYAVYIFSVNSNPCT